MTLTINHPEGKEIGKKINNRDVMEAINILVRSGAMDIPHGSEVAYLRLIFTEPAKNRSIMGRKTLAFTFHPKEPTYVDTHGDLTKLVSIGPKEGKI